MALSESLLFVVTLGMLWLAPLTRLQRVWVWSFFFGLGLSFYGVSLDGYWLSFALFVVALGGAWLAASWLSWVQSTVLDMAVLAAAFMVLGYGLGTDTLFSCPPGVLGSKAFFWHLHTKHVLLSWMILGVFVICASRLQVVGGVLAACLLLFVCAYTPFALGLIALGGGMAVWALALWWPRLMMVAVGALWGLGLGLLPLWIRLGHHVLSFVYVGGAFKALKARLLHGQELLVVIDQHVWWGYGWLKGPLLSRTCVLMPFDHPHHRLLQLWLEGGAFMVVVIVGGVWLALARLWPYAPRSAPFLGWLMALLVLGAGGELWFLGWPLGALITGVMTYGLCLGLGRTLDQKTSPALPPVSQPTSQPASQTKRPAVKKRGKKNGQGRGPFLKGRV